MFDDARMYLKDLVRFPNSYPSSSVSFVFDEIVRVYKDFFFSPTVFDMLLKAHVESGLRKEVLFVFDNMGKCGRNPGLRSCNSLLSRLEVERIGRQFRCMSR